MFSRGQRIEERERIEGDERGMVANRKEKMSKRERMREDKKESVSEVGLQLTVILIIFAITRLVV